MNFRTRHMAIVTYAGLAALLVLKDIINTPETAIAFLAQTLNLFFCFWLPAII